LFRDAGAAAWGRAAGVFVVALIGLMTLRLVGRLNKEAFGKIFSFSLPLARFSSLQS